MVWRLERDAERWGGGWCNRNPETRQKLCGAVRWYRAAVVKRLWRRRLIPETRVRSPVATHLLTSLNLPVSSLALDSNWIPVTKTDKVDSIEYQGSIAWCSLWRHWMHLRYMHLVTSDDQFHCTRLYLLRPKQCALSAVSLKYKTSII